MVAGRRGDGEQDRVQSGSCGISAKKDWADSDMFGKIGQFITTLPAAGARELPAGDNAGVAALRRAAGVFGQNVSMVLQGIRMRVRCWGRVRGRSRTMT